MRLRNLNDQSLSGESAGTGNDPVRCVAIA